MKINCDDWPAALEYFLDPATQAKMKQCGLFIERMDGKTKTVHVGCEDDAEYLTRLTEADAEQTG